MVTIPFYGMLKQCAGNID